MHVQGRDLDLRSARYPAPLDKIIRDPVRIGEGKLWTYQSVRLVDGENQILGIRCVRMGSYEEMNMVRGDFWVHRWARDLTMYYGYTSTICSISPCVRRRE